LRELRVVVAHPRDAEGELIIRCLQRGGAGVKCAWPPPPAPDHDLDLLVCLVDAASRSLLETATAAPGLAVLGVLDPQRSDNVRLVGEVTPHALMLKPVEAADIVPHVVVAATNAKFQQRQQSKISKLEETLRSYRKVEQAKAILMKQRQIDEPEAYNFLREQAMRRRVSVGMIASAVVELDDVLSDKKR
jgi:AmiR/NasT family two-component response regulator